MDMDCFRKSVGVRIGALSALCIFAAGAAVYYLLVSADNGNDGNFTSGAREGFVLGLIFGIGILSFIMLVKLAVILKDDKKLKLLYHKENDERMKLIRSKAGMPTVMIMSVLMIAAGIIAESFSFLVFYTLVIAGIVQLMIAVAIKFYYIKKLG